MGMGVGWGLHGRKIAQDTQLRTSGKAWDVWTSWRVVCVLSAEVQVAGDEAGGVGGTVLWYCWAL